MRAYLAGPMMGYVDDNIPAFKTAAEILEKRGYEILLPADIGDNAVWSDKSTWADYLTADIKIIADIAEGVIFLPGWEKSRGARLEAYVGLLTGKPMWEYIDNGEALEELTYPYVAGVCAAQFAPKEALVRLGLIAA